MCRYVPLSPSDVAWPAVFFSPSRVELGEISNGSELDHRTARTQSTSRVGVNLSSRLQPAFQSQTNSLTWFETGTTVPHELTNPTESHEDRVAFRSISWSSAWIQGERGELKLSVGAGIVIQAREGVAAASARAARDGERDGEGETTAV
jgi:hypothetical protein